MIDVLVIGSGPAGYTAAIYAKRAGRNVKLITGLQKGGQLMITTFIENYPGFCEPITGPELMDRMCKQAELVGVEVENEAIEYINFSRQPFECISESGIKYISKSVIIATGANAKWLGAPGEKKYHGAGVSACATCDGFFFKNKRVAVIGGGNTAVEEAIFLSNFASKVTLIHRRNSLRAERIMQDKLFKNEKVEVIWNAKVEEIVGNDKKVTGIALSDTVTEKQITIDVDGIFIAIGHEPATKIFQNQVELNQNGYIVVKNGSTHTSVDGIFAAGDVCDPVYKQAITSAGQGCMAAIDADKFLSYLG